MASNHSLIMWIEQCNTRKRCQRELPVIDDSHKTHMNRVKVSKKLNILCLHGYFQSAQIMKEHTPALYRKLKSIADFCNCSCAS